MPFLLVSGKQRPFIFRRDAYPDYFGRTTQSNGGNGGLCLARPRNDNRLMLDWPALLDLPRA